MSSVWLKTVTKASLAILISPWLITGFAVKDGWGVSIAQSSSPQTAIAQSRQIYGCHAESRERLYEVDQLSRDAKSFDMAIYQKKLANSIQDSDYIGTVQVNVTSKGSDLVGVSQTSNSKLTVNAFGRTVAFIVEDSVVGSASGRCDVAWQMADSKTRRLVRQCLALVARKYGSVPEVARFGCTGDPSAYIDEVRRP